MKYIALALLVLFLMSCGYKPSAKYSRMVVGDKISTSVDISLVDPENTVLIKDALDLAIVEVFHASLVSKKEASTHLNIRLGNPTYSPIQYDRDGFIVSYRTTIRLLITRQTAGEIKNYVAIGTFDFSVAPNSIITDKQRFDAIKFSSNKAIQSFLAQVSAEGARKNN